LSETGLQIRNQVHMCTHMHSVHFIAVVLLLLFSALSAIDGLYLHLYRLRLHARPASWNEHLWHTMRSVLFVPMVLALFATRSGGLLLWFGIVVVAIDQLVEALDAASERPARLEFGGLSSFEYGLHLMLTTARAAALTAVLVSRPAQAWGLDAPLVLEPLAAPWSFLTLQLALTGVVVALVHVVLAVKHCPLNRCQTA